jgi:hypothetical protein
MNDIHDEKGSVRFNESWALATDPSDPTPTIPAPPSVTPACAEDHPCPHCGGTGRAR